MKNYDPFRSIFDLSFALVLVFIFISAIYMRISKKYEGIIQQNMFRNKTQYVISEEDLFNYGEYRFKDKKKAELMINQAFESINKQVLEYEKITKKKKPIKNILIIGHTDNRPFAKSSQIKQYRFDYDNWNLSLDRAKEIVNLIIEKNLLDKYPNFNEIMILPAGKSFLFPNIEFVRDYLINVKGIKSIDNQNVYSLFEDEIWNYILINFSKEQINELIEYCNNTNEKRIKNRRIQIRLEI
ncbi:MAG: hypothetical protein XD76_0599 [candidate division TA06 bacterium 32_111]|uniref:OmpA-like domain-containing protein n=2 Tax=Bacteria candidate phyla TaxID=1783234 RepID=A0A101I351_UNCT6|nr:MAG: hypothetical protein XD76_0599 [candidate division TA06 bacterium 32_111]KUK87785.1 MAG: hypothetical protein XE03_0304 [candidate division TA06 bacterium 34_109]HAF07940.1 hypothetical protein [candidate division WOR-3 bacterium]HCP16358.1 hypothetical protein [candidate division WOR-3 bacterium]